MKYKLLLISLLISQIGTAQMEQGTFVFGPRVGLQANKINLGDNPQKTVSKLSMQYHAGIFTRLNMGKFSLQPEAVFQIKGSTLKTPDSKNTYRYLSTPILLGVSPMKGLVLEAGPEFSWALNQGWKKEGVQQFGPDAKRDKALVLGARIDMLDMLSMFSVNLRYVQGLDNVTTTTFENKPLEYKNRTFQLSITYNFSEYYKWWKKYGLKKPKKTANVKG